MNERDETRLRDKLDAALKAKRFTLNKTRDVLDSDEILALALVRLIEIIGEAAGKVTQEGREKYPQIPWKNVVGMRNKIIHDYLNVDYDIVWETVASRIPELITELEKIVPPEEEAK